MSFQEWFWRLRALNGLSDSLNGITSFFEACLSLGIPMPVSGGAVQGTALTTSGQPQAQASVAWQTLYRLGQNVGRRFRQCTLPVF